MRRKFGDLYDWDVPELQKTVGPFSPEAFNEFKDKLDFVRSEAFRSLKAANPDELNSIYEEWDTEAWRHWRHSFSKVISDLNDDLPHWADGGLGHPKYCADFEYWARMPDLLLEEAVGLTVGVEPKHLRSWIELDDAEAEIMGPSFVFVKRRSLQLHRQFKLIHSSSKIDLKELLDWAKLVDLEVHSDALAALERFHGKPPMTGKTRADQTRFTSQERDTLLKLVAAMACEQYKYDPSEERSQAIGSIRDDIEQIGQSMDAKTIRKWLKEAAAFVDGDYWK